ncbi:MAG: hypothetical protein DI570_06280 [Phenylobacterium zucineum]|nr:MAG: hypothetical protein DI570_06280 [Phenylobacterium zucineum]
MRCAYVAMTAALALAGCGQTTPEEPAAKAQAPSVATPAAAAPNDAPVEPLPPGSPGALPDDRTPISEAPFTPESAQGAGQVVQTYFALLESGRAAEGRGSWSDAAQADAFVAGLGEFRSFHTLIGAPGEIEGAAGSLYVEVPVQLYGRLKDGREGHRIGAATLRRVNGVPGASADQLRWRLSGVVLRPAP